MDRKDEINKWISKIIDIEKVQESFWQAFYPVIFAVFPIFAVAGVEFFMMNTNFYISLQNQTLKGQYVIMAASLVAPIAYYLRADGMKYKQNLKFKGMLLVILLAFFLFETTITGVSFIADYLKIPIKNDHNLAIFSMWVLLASFFSLWFATYLHETRTEEEILLTVYEEERKFSAGYNRNDRKQGNNP